jgi:molybdopterin converting factor subunit 1
VGVAELQLELKARCTAGELMDRVCHEFPALVPHRALIRMAVNGSYVDDDHPVSAGDEVALIPPVAGG